LLRLTVFVWTVATENKQFSAIYMARSKLYSIFDGPIYDRQKFKEKNVENKWAAEKWNIFSSFFPIIPLKVVGRQKHYSCPSGPLMSAWGIDTQLNPACPSRRLPSIAAAFLPTAAAAFPPAAPLQRSCRSCCLLWPIAHHPAGGSFGRPRLLCSLPPPGPTTDALLGHP
jgi:hypothetical protein